MNKLEKYKDFISKYEIFEDISEGLFKSADPCKFIDIFQRILSSKDVKFLIDYEYNGNIFVDIEKINKEDLKFSFSIIGNSGYYVSDFKINEEKRKFDNDEVFSYFYSNDKIDITLFVEPYYDVELSNVSILYHTTPQIYIEKILKNGLSPKSKNKITSHPPRIFLCKSINKAISLSKMLKARSNYNCNWSVLEINTENIIDFKIYEDPNYRKEGGVYTLNYIQPDNIKDLEMNI